MSLFNLRKNERVKVKVLTRRQFSNKAIFEVDYCGRKCQVPMFEFQKSLPLPDELECVVSTVTDTTLYLQQNIAALLRQRYSENQIYEFTVDSDFTATSTPFYKLTDGSGFYFKLHSKGQKFTINRRIKCRVKRIRGVEIDLEYVGLVHEMNDSFKLSTLLPKIGYAARRLVAAFRNAPWVAEIATLYEANSAEWLPMAIESTLRTFETTKLNFVEPIHLGLLNDLKHTIVWFLEDSDYFDKFPENDRYQWQSRFGAFLRHCDALIAAYSTIIDSHQEAYVDKIVRKFKASGYLIDADHKLLSLKCVLSIDPSVLNKVIGEVIDVVVTRRNDCLREPVFSRSFIDLLQLYVDNNHHALDEMDEAETEQAKAALSTMVKVLSIQLLLAGPEEENLSHIDFEINRSRLYRYLTLQNNSGDDELLDKALKALLACESPRAEYTWNDVTEIIKISSRLRQPSSVATIPALFEAPTATLKVSESSISLDENSTTASLVRVFPIAHEMWRDMEINLAEPLSTANREPRTIPQYKRLWAEIERRLTVFSEPEESRKIDVRTVPGRGQQVKIQILEADPTNRTRFRCQIADDAFRGEGWIDKKDITSSNQEVTTAMFTAPDGTPLRLPATVVGSKGEQLQFSLSDTLNAYIDSIIHYNDIEDCLVLTKIGDTCTVLSRRGFTLNVELDDDHDFIERGDMISVTNLEIEGQWRGGEFDGLLGKPRFDFAEVMTRLMRNFAGGIVDTDGNSNTDDEFAETGALQDANRMGQATVVELIRIIESVASRLRENIAAYNYFAYARLLAKLIDDNVLADYFDKRCGLLEEFDDFSTNGHVDLAHLEQLMRGLSMENNSLSVDGEKLRIISVLDHPENNNYLWGIFGTNANESLQELARLVLAYNMLDGFKMREQRHDIREKIYSKLKVQIEKEPTVVANGREGLKTEFKTSIAYPANSMRLDVEAQTFVIMKVIASFLNTEGGTLYVGVSDEGYVRGLAADLSYFRSKDSFDRHVHDNIRHHLSYIPNLHLFVETEWVENSGKEIYVVKVKPNVEPVALDGAYYYREGSSCVLVRADQEKRFLAAFRGGAQPIQTSSAAAPVIPSPTSVAPIEQHPTILPSATPAAEVAAPPKGADQERLIATSEFRNNVLHDGYAGYEHVSDYLYIYPDGHFDLSDSDRWLDDSCALALGIHPAEAENDMVVVATDGHTVKFPFAALSESDGRLSPKNTPMFVAPINADDKLIMIYRSADGTPYKCVFATDDLHTGRVDERGELPSREIAKVLFCEIVRPDAQASFKSLTRKQRIGKDEASIQREQSAILERLRKE